MSKKNTLFLAGAIVVFIGIGGFTLVQGKKNISSPLPVEEKQQTSILASKTLKEYTDSSGFSFQYPDNLSLHANKVEDTTKYADMLFTTNGTPGALKLEISDTTLTSVDEWLKRENIIAELSPKETTLGELSAKEVSGKNTRILAAIDKGILFTIRLSFDGQDAFWTTAYDTIRETFSFIQEASQITTSQSTTTTSDENVSFEGEEMVE